MRKRHGFAVLRASFFLFLLCIVCRRDVAASESPDLPRRDGIALIITGAAARIPQEAALLEELDRRGLLKDLVFISGDSSGALNAVALNAVLSGRITWEGYKGILFRLTNGDIFRRSGRRLPVDTSPARGLYRRIVEDRFGFRSMGDLPIPTSITITRLRDLGLRTASYRMCSVKINAESDPSLGLVDILMATSSIPVVFPPARIRGASTIPDTDYVDGGAGEDYVPFTALLQFEKYRGRGVEKVYIISRKSDETPELSDELRELGLDDHRLLDRLGISFDALADRKLLERLDLFRKEAPELASRTYIWKPDFVRSFLLLSFDNLEDQYAVTREWAKSRVPVPLEEYLASHAEQN